MKIKEALDYGTVELNKVNISNPINEALLLLVFILDCDRVYVYSNFDQQLRDDQFSLYKKYIKQRMTNRPLSYITGNREFMSLNFFVNENVLIPRPDTEILVESLLKYVINSKEEKNILEIGTGSGCISISVAYYSKKAKVTAIDISEEALKIARKNANRHKMLHRVEFIKSDIYENLNLEKFDYIVSNPPYIPSKDVLVLEEDVKDFEPITALDGGDDGLDFYRDICKNAKSFLKEDGMIFFEIGYNQAKDVKKIMSAICKDIVIVKDYGQNDRIIYGKVN